MRQLINLGLGFHAQRAGPKHSLTEARGEAMQGKEGSDQQTVKANDAQESKDKRLKELITASVLELGWEAPFRPDGPS